MADAEQVVAQIWRVLEEHRVASPQLALAVQGGDRVDLSLTFGAAPDAELVRCAWAVPGLPPIAELETGTREPATGSARSGRETTIMDYRCHLLGLSGSIRAAHEITCKDDEVAVAKARELFHPHAFEVWQRQRRVYPVMETSRDLHHAANVERARRWRLQAEECRTVADQMHNPMAQASLRRMAETYDRLADHLERRTAGVEQPKKPEAG